MKNIWRCAYIIGIIFSVVTCAGYAHKRITEWLTIETWNSQHEKVENWAKPDLEYLEYFGLEAFETTLPVVYIDTDNQRISKEYPIRASLAVLDEEADGEAHSILEVPDYNAAITIKYRGASSYSGFDKKQFRIKFYENENSSKSKEYSFLGMGSNSEWVLNGPFLDKTLMRNRLAYKVAGEIFEWAPDTRYVEVFLDGEYQGVYLAVEPVTNGVSRLRLSKFGLLSGDTSYIVKRDRIGTEEMPLEVYGKIAAKTNNDLFVEYPGKSSLTETQREWVTNDISKFEEVLYGENFADPVYGYAKYIDIDSFVDYYVFNEVFMNNDAGDLSTYVYKELNGKLQMAVWDYNNCYDNYQWFTQDFKEFFVSKRAWFSRLLQDRAFVDRIIERYEELRKDILSKEYFATLLGNFQKELGTAIERNFAVWGYTFEANLLIGNVEYLGINQSRDLKSYEAAVEQLKKAIDLRFEFLDNNIQELYSFCVN